MIVSLAKHTSLKSAGRDSLVNLENITGSRYADKLFGNSEDNVLIGGGGKDKLVGGGGRDRLVQ